MKKIIQLLFIIIFVGGVALKYDDASDFSEGLAAVCVGGSLY